MICSKYFFLTLFFSSCIIFTEAIAQDTLNPAKILKKNAVGLELGGTGMFYSIYYERYFSIKEKVSQSLKAGVYYPITRKDINALYLPFDYNIYLGKKNIKLLMGAGGMGIFGTSPFPKSLSAQADYRNLYNTNSYSAVSKYGTGNFSPIADIAFTGKVGITGVDGRMSWNLFYNFFYIRFTYKYYFQPVWFGAGLSFKI